MIVQKVIAVLFAVCVLVGCSSSKKPSSPDGDDPFDNAGDRDDAGAAHGGASGDGSGGDGSSGDGSSGDGSSGRGSTAGSGAGGSMSGGGLVDGGTASDPLALCGGPCACADGMDNDGDGVTDGFDAECTGAADDDEGTFATGIPGDNRDPKWQDCFFDGNSGGGDDGCRYATGCLTGELEASHKNCTVTQQCLDFCKPRTPNGCDCFGCCTFTLGDGSTKSVRLEAKCEEGSWEGCTECVPATDCNNECGRCELCPGKEVEDLPADCTPPPPSAGSGGAGGVGGMGGTGGTGEPPPPYTCDEGQGVCSDSSNCPSGYYCSFGCCTNSVI